MGATTQELDEHAAREPARGSRRRHAVDDDALRAAISSATSWRGVLRHLGLPGSASGTARRLRHRADQLGYCYGHFGYQQPQWGTAELHEAVTTSHSWSEALERLGFAEGSSSARDSVRRVCVRSGIDTKRLDEKRVPTVDQLPVTPRPEHLRSAGAMLVAAALTLAGHRVSWPLEPAVYDLLVDVEGQPAQRVQVKTSTCSVAGTWLCTLTRSSAHDGRYSLDDIDQFGIVDGDHVIYLVPAAVVGGLTSIYTRAYATYRIGRLTA